MDIQMSLQWRNPTGSLSFHYHYHLISSPSMATLFSAQKIDNCNIRPWNSGKLPWNYYVSINFGWLLRYLRHKHRDFARIDDVPTKKTSISFGDFPRNHVDDQIDVCFNGFKGQITMAKSSISTKYWIWLGKWWRRLPRADFFFFTLRRSHWPDSRDVPIGSVRFRDPRNTSARGQSGNTQAPARKMWWHLAVSIVKRC